MSDKQRTAVLSSLLTILALLVLGSFWLRTAHADTLLPLVLAGQQRFRTPIHFEGDFTLFEDGSGTCDGSFVVDEEVWEDFMAGTVHYNSVWVGIGEIFDGYPYGPDEEHPEFNAMWDFIEYMSAQYPWPDPWR